MNPNYYTSFSARRVDPSSERNRLKPLAYSVSLEPPSRGKAVLLSKKSQKNSNQQTFLVDRIYYAGATNPRASTLQPVTN